MPKWGMFSPFSHVFFFPVRFPAEFLVVRPEAEFNLSAPSQDELASLEDAHDRTWSPHQRDRAHELRVSNDHNTDHRSERFRTVQSGLVANQLYHRIWGCRSLHRGRNEERSTKPVEVFDTGIGMWTSLCELPRRSSSAALLLSQVVRDPGREGLSAMAPLFDPPFEK